MRHGGFRQVLALLALTAALACTPIYRNHGYLPPETDLAQVTVGLTTREEALALLGRPTAERLIDDRGIYYVRSRFRHFGALAPQEVERTILAVTFDAADRVANVERFGLEDGNIVALSRRVTDDGIQDTTFLRQLFGAVGNFDAGRFLGGE